MSLQLRALHLILLLQSAAPPPRPLLPLPFSAPALTLLTFMLTLPLPLRRMLHLQLQLQRGWLQTPHPLSYRQRLRNYRLYGSLLNRFNLYCAHANVTVIDM